MIDPGAIPQVGGDLEAVAAAGAQLKAQGRAVADTGADVHAAWQGLGSVYEAPEAGQLLAATGPVRAQAAGVGGRLERAGSALVAYADEVRPIRAQLDRLRVSASSFVASVDGDEDWRSDGGKVQEHNGLLTGVSGAVAAWMDAQRRCASSISVLSGGVRYVADNGDGVVQAGEYGYTTEALTAAGSDAGVPWGRPEQEDLPWWKDAGHAVASFVKGGAVDSIGAAVQDFSHLLNPWSDQFGAAWEGLGTFALAVTVIPTVINHYTALPGLERGELGRTLQDAGKSMVAWDTWKTDPARALGATLTNIVTAVIGTKGAGGAVKSGTAGAARTGLARGIAVLPKTAQIRAAVTTQIAKLPKIELPQLHPALANGTTPGRYHFDVEQPGPDTGRMNSQAPGGTPGASEPTAGSSSGARPGASAQPLQGALGDAFRGGVHDPDGLLLKKEREVADLLAESGYDVRPRPAYHAVPYQKSPDLLVRTGPLDAGTLTEIKTLESASSGSVRRNILSGAPQAAVGGQPGDVLLDGRAAGLTRESAERGWARAVGQAAKHGQCLPRRLTILLADGTVVVRP